MDPFKWHQVSGLQVAAHLVLHRVLPLLIGGGLMSLPFLSLGCPGKKFTLAWMHFRVWHTSSSSYRASLMSLAQSGNLRIADTRAHTTSQSWHAITRVFAAQRLVIATMYGHNATARHATAATVLSAEGDNKSSTSRINRHWPTTAKAAARMKRPYCLVFPGFGSTVCA